MKIHGDRIKISSGAVDAKGQKLEPEQQLARREVLVDAPVKLGAGSVGTNVGTMKSSIVFDQTAGEQALASRFLCGNCKHFKNDRWLRDLDRADSPDAPIEKRRAVNKIRAALIQTRSSTMTEQSVGQDGDMDLEHALKMLGYCAALYSYFKNAGKTNEDAMTLVHPASTCPADVRTSANPNGLFEYVSPEAEKLANRNYDRIMQMAAGKKP